jgi:hypothetical protein
MAGTVDAGELKLTLKLMRENFAQGMKAVEGDLKKLETGAAKTGKTAKTAFTGMENSLMNLLAPLAAVAGGTAVVDWTWRAFTDKLAEDQSIIRATIAQERLGIATAGLDENLQALGRTYILAGQREMSAYTGYRKMVQATGDDAEATRQLNIALKFAVAQGVDVETVTNDMARAYGGKQRAIQMLLSELGLLNGSLKDYQQLEQILIDGSVGYEKVLDERAQAVNGLAASWDSFGDTFGTKVAPAIVAGLKTITAIIDKPLLMLLAMISPQDAQREMMKYIAEAGTQAIIDAQGPSPFVGPVLPNRTRKTPARFGEGDGKPKAATKGTDYDSWWQSELRARAKAEEDYEKLWEGWQKKKDAAWLESTRTWRDGIDKTADSLGYLLIDLPFKGKDAWRSFIDSMLSMLREMGAEFVSTTLKAQGLVWLKQLTGYGGGGEYEEKPGFIGPHLTGLGGPRPIGPGMGGGMQPVYVTVSGSLTEYAEFKIVSTGLRQGRQAGF